MEFDTELALLGVHVLVALVFVLFAIPPLLGGELIGGGLRLLLAVLFLGLGGSLYYVRTK